MEFSLLIKGNSAICDNTNRPWRHAKCNEPVLERQKSCMIPIIWAKCSFLHSGKVDGDYSLNALPKDHVVWCSFFLMFLCMPIGRTILWLPICSSRTCVFLFIYFIFLRKKLNDSSLFWLEKHKKSERDTRFNEKEISKQFPHKYFVR